MLLVKRETIEPCTKKGENFHLVEFNSNSSKLAWDYLDDLNVYFEIYRNQNNKMACNDSSLIGITTSRELLMRILRVGLWISTILEQAINYKTKPPILAPKGKGKTPP